MCIKYIDKIKNICKKCKEKDELSHTGLKQIKQALHKSNDSFPVTDSILLTININADMINNTCDLLTELLPEYNDVSKWNSNHIGDILFIITTLKEITNSRICLRVLRCYNILLDDYIYNLYTVYKNGEDNSPYYKNLNSSNQRLLKCIMTDMAMTKGEEALLFKS